MSDQPGEKKIVYWADLIRVIAIFLVVVAHVSGQLTDIWAKTSNRQWLIADVYGGIARVCVPLFFMISGYLLLPRSEDLKVFYSKRIPKILIPLLVWSLIYLGWYCGTHANTCTPSLVSDLLLVKGAYFHLWFLYSLLGIYLILPILQLIVRADPDKKLLWYFMLLWLLFGPILSLAHKLWNFDINLRAPLAGGFVGYFFLGYLLGEMTLTPPRVILSAVMWVLGTFVTILGTYLFTHATGQFDGFFYDYVSIGVAFASPAAFILLRWLSESNLFASHQTREWMRVLAISAFGVYLIHVIVMEVLSDWIPSLHINSLMGNAIWSIPFVSAVVFVISFLIVRLLQKIPIVQQIIP